MTHFQAIRIVEYGTKVPLPSWTHVLTKDTVPCGVHSTNLASIFQIWVSLNGEQKFTHFHLLMVGRGLETRKQFILHYFHIFEGEVLGFNRSIARLVLKFVRSFTQKLSHISGSVGSHKKVECFCELQYLGGPSLAKNLGLLTCRAETPESNLMSCGDARPL